ncbi:alcohol oxidase [Amylostereum chailletii]|nr:alcohol oxidase [Amylostereum chailletii]
MTARVEQVSGKTFDYIVLGVRLTDASLGIGGGTTGLVVATRLTEDPSVSVLVLEAGLANLDDPELLAPAAFASHFGKPQYDWGYTTVPQKGSSDRSVYWARGKGLGGSSGINFFQYHLPAKSDVDAFEKLGNAGWNWDLFKTYYNKSEKFEKPAKVEDTMSLDLNEHGTQGPLSVAYPITFSGLEPIYHETLRKMGIQRVAEPTKGTWLTPVTIHPTQRVRTYAANMYLKPVLSRGNLTVLVSSHVCGISTTTVSDGVKATSVTFVNEGKSYEAFVQREVIVAAGAIGSPQVLELSGIGSDTVLKKVGVDVKVNLPGVGNNVQEHVFTGASYEMRDDVKDQFLTFDCLRDPTEKAKQEELYKNGGTSVFGMSSICMTFLPLSSFSSNASALQDDLRKSIKAGVDANKFSPALQKQYKIQLEHLDKKEPSCEVVCVQGYGSTPNLPEPQKKYVTMCSCINHPFTRGEIHISSQDPLQPPLIDPHYFEQAYDLQSFVELIKFNRRVVELEPMKGILTGKELNPGSECQTDAEIAEWLAKNHNTTYHTIGSCSMLPREDGGVVDTRLKVYGTSNIRVVDVSVLPVHIGAHLQATAYALGEIAADIVKGNIFKA